MCISKFLPGSLFHLVISSCISKFLPAIAGLALSCLLPQVPNTVERASRLHAKYKEIFKISVTSSIHLMIGWPQPLLPFLVQVFSHWSCRIKWILQESLWLFQNCVGKGYLFYCRTKIPRSHKTCTINTATMILLGDYHWLLFGLYGNILNYLISIQRIKAHSHNNFFFHFFFMTHSSERLRYITVKKMIVYFYWKSSECLIIFVWLQCNFPHYIHRKKPRTTWA